MSFSVASAIAYCYPWEYRPLSLGPNGCSNYVNVVSCVPLENDPICSDLAIEPKRESGIWHWLRTRLSLFQKSRWSHGVYCRLTRDGRLYAKQLALDHVIDFALCENYLYVLTAEQISRYELPHPSYWNRSLLDYQLPAQPKSLSVIGPSDDGKHIFRVSF